MGGRYHLPMPNPRSGVLTLSAEVERLTPSQKNWLYAFVRQLRMPHHFSHAADSDLMTQDVRENIGDLLRIHHVMSKRPLSKAPFEYAFEKALQLAGKSASLASSATNPGYDMTIEATRFSLKTEASRTVKEDQIHVSKWMEMGKGEWDPPRVQLQRFIQHLTGYDRILTLRCLLQTGAEYRYELVEIPKALMLEAQTGTMERAGKTTQNTFPWYRRVADSDGSHKYSLYVDAGSERKLQVKSLKKKHCFVHATWSFKSMQLTGDDSREEAA